MRDPADRPEPPTPRRPAGRSRRPRFALPADHHDERTSERIEAFLEGPRPHRTARQRHPKAGAVRQPRRAIPLDTRADWEIALRHEDARMARYGRPGSVLVLELRGVDPGAADRVAVQVGQVIREHARETDRVARVSRDRFQVLLPETLEAEACALAERVRQACRTIGQIRPETALTIAAAAAGPMRGGGLVDALQRAQEGLHD